MKNHLGYFMFKKNTFIFQNFAKSIPDPISLKENKISPERNARSTEPNILSPIKINS